MFPSSIARSRTPSVSPCLTVLAPVSLALCVATPLAAQSGAFGHAVVIAADEILIAEPTTTFRPGAVHIHRRSGATWRASTLLRAPEPERADGFGTLLASTGNTLFVGQRGGPLHVFERDDGGDWLAAGTIGDGEIAGRSPECRFDGYCGTDFGLALAAGGDWLMVGVTGSGATGEAGTEAAEPRGAVHAYRREGDGEWVRQAKLQPSDGVGGDRFGATIAFTPHGVLIGAPGWHTGGGEDEAAGRVYRYRLGEGGWEEAGALESVAEAGANFGAAISAAGDRALVGAPGTDEGRGAVFVHSWDAGLARWVPVAGRVAFARGESGDRFGAAVALAGNDVWVGAPATRGLETGSVFVFEAAGDGSLPAEPRRIRLPRAETVESDRFGALVAGHAAIVAVGAPGMHHEAGSVHLFERGDAGWSDPETLVSAPDVLAPPVLADGRCADGRVGPFDCEGLDLVAYLPTSLLKAGGRARGVRTNDNWGWTDPETGHEYALVGRNDGTSFVDITDPANPVLVGDLPKTPDTPPSQLWRDIKTYGDHAFVVADGAGGHGMQVFDLARLRELSPDEMPVLFEPDAHYTEIASSHNIVVNEETGFAYAVGSRHGGESCGGGLHMIDIRDPKNPKFAGCGSSDAIHDSQCVVYRGPDERYRGRELCLNSNGDAFQITDVTDRESPVEVSSVSSPNPAYIHQGWLTPDHRHFYQDDEADVIAGNVETTRTLIWDLGDVEDPVLVTEFMGSRPASAHNLYIKDGLAYQANYRYGLHILDISDPENPRETAAFDTSPHQQGPGFGGAWSNYPYFESGTVIVTSMQEGLFLLRKRERPVG